MLLFVVFLNLKARSSTSCRPTFRHVGLHHPHSARSYHFLLTTTFTQMIFRLTFYRAMHFSAKRSIAIACRLFVCPSVCLSVRPYVRLSVTLMNCDHIGWNSSKIISPLVSLGRSLCALCNPNMTGLLQGEHP